MRERACKAGRPNSLIVSGDCRGDAGGQVLLLDDVLDLLGRHLGQGNGHVCVLRKVPTGPPAVAIS